MGSQYTFYDYINSQGENETLQWLKSIGGRGKDRDKLKAKFAVKLLYLEGTHPSNWQRPFIDSLSGECSGLYEIRAEFNKVQYRLIGFHNHERATGTLVFGAKEIGDKFDPPDTCRRAQAIKTLVESNPTKYRSAHDYS